MRVIHIAKIIQIAGAERHLLTLLPALRAAGIDAQMIVLEKSSTATRSFIDQLEQAGVPTTVLPAPPAQNLVNGAVPSLLRQMRQILRTNPPDIVHTHLIHGDIYGLAAAKLAGVRHNVSSRHNLDPFRRRRKWQIITWGLWRLFSGGIAISDAVRDFVIDVEHAPPAKISTIKYGILPSTHAEDRSVVRREWGIDAHAPVIGSVSRLIKQKGLTHALDAFAQICRDFPDAHYVIAGDGELRPVLEDHARQLGLADSVHFLGWQDNPHRVFAAIDVLLTPSLWEGFGVVFLEAMAHSLPIVSTNVPPMPEIILDGITGYTVAPGSADALIEPLRRLLTDADLRRQMGEAGRTRLLTEFSVDTMTRQTIEFYERILR